MFKPIVWLLTLLILGLLDLAPAAAFTCTATGCTFNARYTEPSTNQTGAPLDNLTSCTVAYTTAINAGTPGLAQAIIIQASSSNGGGTIDQAITDTALVPGHNYTIAATLACTNPSGTGASVAAPALAILRAGEVPPGSGSGFTIQ